MKEIGILNRGVAKLVSEQGHHDLLLLCDAGFAIPKGLEVVDLSIDENKPMLLEVLDVLKNYHSVEGMYLANQTKEVSPTLFENVTTSFDNEVEVKTMEHTEFRELAKSVKGVIRTGDFTAYANVILISGAGKRWYCENQ